MSRAPGSIPRRDFLTATGLLTAGSLTGCMGSGDGAGGTNRPTPDQDGLDTVTNRAGNRVGATFEAVEALAETEGSLTVYTTLAREVVDRHGRNLRETYPWLTLKTIVGGDSDVYPRWMAEHRSGTVNGDMVITGSMLRPLIASGTTMDLSSRQLPNYEVLAPAYKSDHLAGIQQTVGALQYNSDLLGPDAVSSWADLVTAPRWQGQLGFDPSPQRELLWGLLAHRGGVASAEARTFLEQLRAQRPRWIDGNTERSSRCAAGEFPICFSSTDVLTASPDLPLEVFAGPRAFSAVEAASISDRANNPNAALLFLDWLLSEPGQRSISRTETAVTSGPDVPGGKQEIPDANLTPILPTVDSDAAVELWDEVMSQFSRY